MKALITLSLCLLIGLPGIFCMPGFAADDTYPHITTLETEILGQTHIDEELSARISRMEAKAFGKASSDSDLSQRTDNLEDYCQKTLHKKPFGSDLDTDQQTYSGDQSPAADQPVADNSSSSDSSAPTEYPHITYLEKSILEQTYPNDQLPDRLARMETKAFGKSSDSQALVDRTDALDDYAEKKLHKQPYAQEQREEALAHGGVPVEGAAGAGGRSKLLMSIAASTLLSAAGGYLMPGFGGINMIPRSAVNSGAPAQSDKPPEIQDDPAVKAATPPPAGAKIQTQVGWCEMQLFGHTCHTMHLTERLKQLNLDLNYAPTKKPMDLMDDMDGLMKAVVTKKQKKQ